MSVVRSASVVSGPSAGLLTVSILGEQATRKVVATAAVTGVASGAQVLVVSDSGQAWAVAVTSTTSTPTPTMSGDSLPVIGPETMTTLTGVEVLAPSWSGTWVGGAWREDTQDVMQGDGLSGAVFWAGMSLFGKIMSASVTLARSGGWTPAVPTMGLLAGGWDPSAFPEVLATVAGPALEAGSSTSWRPPVEWLPRFQSGEAGGIGLVGDEPCTINGPAAAAAITWEG